MSNPNEGASALVAVALPPALEMDEEELVGVLSRSVYPGAELASIKLAISYCRAARLDPLQKPIHIVPMKVQMKGRRGEKDEWQWMDVLMPGIGLYRTQAARSGLYAGLSEPEFGPLQEMQIDQFTLKFPEWCKVTAYRLHAATGQVFEFPAIEYWLENYATAGRDTAAPNSMWKRRVRGQISKCAEAQALRKAFPEIVGSLPTAEEMVGRDTIDVEDLPRGSIDATARSGPPVKPPVMVGNEPSETATFVATGSLAPAVVPMSQPAAASAPAAATPPPAVVPKGHQGTLDVQPGDEAPAGVGERAYVVNKAATLKVDLASLLTSIDCTSIDALTKGGFRALRAQLAAVERGPQ